MILEKGLLEIHPQFDKLRIALRTAIENGEGILDKEATSHDDIFDAFRLSIKVLQVYKLANLLVSPYMPLAPHILSQ